MGSEQVRSLRVARRINVRFHEKPIELEFRELHVAPDEFRRKRWFESRTLPLVRVRQRAPGSVDCARRNAAKIDGLAIGKSKLFRRG